MSDWRKSSYSNDNGGNCVEAATGTGVILVRDTANRAAATLAFAPDTWELFTASLR